MSAQSTRVYLGRAVDHLLAATADLQAAILNNPSESAALVPVVLGLAAYTDTLDETLTATYAQPTAPTGGAA